LWHIDPLLGKDLETNNETTAVAMQQRGKHAYNNRVAVGNGVMQPVSRHLHYNNENGGVLYVVRDE
jgi:hypothetical protein